VKAHDTKAFGALFDPQGVIVAGASSHPGKFGFVVLHNILRHGYGGKVFATNVDGGEILGVEAQPISCSSARRSASTPTSCATARARECGLPL
jgi:predicted CoA-binding protein